MKKLKLWPIVAGILVDTVGTIAVGVLYFLLVFGIQIARGTLAGEDSFATHLVVAEVIGLTMTVLGGFIAARMATVLSVQHGTAVGIGALVVGLLVEWVSPLEGVPTWYEVVSSVGVIPAGALGGYLAGRLANKRSQRTA